jgi:hypothetical protein
MQPRDREALSSLRLTWAPTTDDLWRPQAGLHVSGLNEGPLSEVLAAVDDARLDPDASPLGVVLRGQAGSGKTHMLGQVREPGSWRAWAVRASPAKPSSKTCCGNWRRWRTCPAPTAAPSSATTS